MNDIFISYAHEDREKAERLARVFEEQRWTVWWDKEIAPGKLFADVIVEELAGAKAVVVLWSRSSVASNWVRDEAQDGLARGVLVPVLTDTASPPHGFRQVQTADLSGWDGSPSDPQLLSLLGAVGALIDKPAVAPPPPPPSPARRTTVYLLVVGALALLLGFAAYRLLFRDRDPPANQNRVAVVTGNGGGGRQSCDSDARLKAAEVTGRGLMMIDPGGSHSAAVLQFNEATGVCPAYTEAYFYRGQSFVALKDNERALADFRKVLQLTPDDVTRRLVQKFITDLENPRPTPTPAPTPPPPVPTNTNADVANVNAGTANVGLQPPPSGEVRAQVAELFATEKSARIAATTRSIIERKGDSGFVLQAVRAASAQPDNKSGVINTLVFLESADPALLRRHQTEIERLLKAVEDNGPETTSHVEKVKGRLAAPPPGG